MTEDELIRRLRRGRSSPPPAPAHEWEAIAGRIEDGVWPSFRRPALALAGGLALAALVALPFVQRPQAAAALDESTALEEFLAEAGAALQAPDAAEDEAFDPYF